MKKILIVLIGLFLIFVVIWLLTKDLDNQKKDEIISSPTPSIITPTIKLLPNQDPNIKGSPEIVYSTEEKIILNEMSNLRDKLPLETIFFKLDFDYMLVKFIIKFKDPENYNFENFKNWLETNNYKNIPIENFEIKPLN